jgi:hypothetical protein
VSYADTCLQGVTREIGGVRRGWHVREKTLAAHWCLVDQVDRTVDGLMAITLVEGDVARRILLVHPQARYQTRDPGEQIVAMGSEQQRRRALLLGQGWRDTRVGGKPVRA